MAATWAAAAALLASPRGGRGGGGKKRGWGGKEEEEEEEEGGGEGAGAGASGGLLPLPLLLLLFLRLWLIPYFVVGLVGGRTCGGGVVVGVVDEDLEVRGALPRQQIGRGVAKGVGTGKGSNTAGGQGAGTTRTTATLAFGGCVWGGDGWVGRGVDQEKQCPWLKGGLEAEAVWWWIRARGVGKAGHETPTPPDHKGVSRPYTDRAWCEWAGWVGPRGPKARGKGAREKAKLPPRHPS